MTAPASPARALYEILTAVNERIGQPDHSAYHAWQRVSGHQHGTSGFAMYHAEVVELLSEVAEGLRTLGDSPRARYNQYLHAWWDAIVRPRGDWGAQGQKIIDQNSLHMLAALADLVEARALSAGPPNPQAHEVLAKAVSFLRREVEKDTDLPTTVREQILADLQHVQWLLKNVTIFGVDHAVVAVEKVAGKVTTAAATTRSPRLKKVAIGLIAALALAAPAAGNLDAVVTSVKHIFGIESGEPATAEDKDPVTVTVVEVYNVCTPKELPAGPGASPGDEGRAHDGVVIDGEVVEEAAPE